MTQVLLLSAEGRADYEPAGIGGLLSRAPREPPVWLHLDEDEAGLRALGEAGFHEVAIRSVQGGPERPRVEEYGDHLYVSLIYSSSRPANDDALPTFGTLRAFVGRSWIVTVGDLTPGQYEELCDRARRQVLERGRGVSFFLYVFTEWAVETLLPVLDGLSDRVDDLEDLVVVGARAEIMHELFGLKRELVERRRELTPFRDVLQRLATHGGAYLEEASEVYFRDAHDDVLRILELLDTYRDILSSALDLYLSTVSNRLNQVMKRLAVVATLFMPITFITGFFGMNFARIPYASATLLGAVVAVILVSSGGMLVYFRRAGWW